MYNSVENLQIPQTTKFRGFIIGKYRTYVEFVDGSFAGVH